jgi:hypothetical protein
MSAPETSNHADSSPPKRDPRVARRIRRAALVGFVTVVLAIPLVAQSVNFHQPTRSNATADLRMPPPASPPLTSAYPHNWSRTNTGNSHPQRTLGAAMVFDAMDNYTLLFGGERETLSGGYVVSNETWTYHAGIWAPLRSTAHPSNRISPAMTYDPLHHYVLLFGGSACGHGVFGSCNDTWSFQGGNWTQLHPLLAPPGASWVSMAYDAKTGHVVLFDGTPSSSTWQWQGGTWGKLTPTGTPKIAAYSDFQMFFDPRDDYMVLASADGLTCGGSVYSWCMHTWTFSGGNWTELVNTSTLRATKFSVAWDSSLKEAVLFGGYVNVSPYTLDGTWTFVHGSWTHVKPLASPSLRYESAMAFDGGDGYLFLFGGTYTTVTTSGMLNDSWKLI